MIKKITNWVFGSFFRTMGRFFFFLFFGFLIATIISKSNINFKWTDLLGIETINAETIYSDTIQNAFLQDCSWRIDGGQTASTTTCGWDNNFRTATIDTSQQTSHGTVHFTSTNLDSMYSVLIPGTSNVWLNPYEIEFQVRVDYSWLNSFNSIYIENDPNPGASYYTADIQDNGISFNFFPVYSNLDTQLWKGGLCKTNSSNNDGSYKYYTITCNVPAGAYGVSEIRMMYYYNRTVSQSYNTTLNVGISTNVNYKFRDILIAQQYANSNNIANSVIDVQTMQNETLNYIQDDNTTAANSAATNFFSNFNDSDNGGIRSIITAPLTAISGLVNSSCVQIQLPIPYLNNEYIVLPCMSAIYQEHFGSFFNIYQTIIFGAVAYRMLVSLFMMIQGFKNPDDDKIEVVDL